MTSDPKQFETEKEDVNDDASAEAPAAAGLETPAMEEAAGEAVPGGASREAELEAEVADLKDKLLRTMADMENTRRRAERDRAEAAKYGATSFARDMLQIADNLHRALASLPEGARDGADESVKVLVEGVELTERSLLSAFERHGITPIAPQPGEKFDPNQHEAMMEIPTDAVDPGTVAQVLETGYMMSDRLLRAARVGVARKP